MITQTEPMVIFTAWETIYSVSNEMVYNIGGRVELGKALVQRKLFSAVWYTAKDVVASFQEPENEAMDQMW